MTRRLLFYRVARSIESITARLRDEITKEKSALMNIFTSRHLIVALALLLFALVALPQVSAQNELTAELVVVTGSDGTSDRPVIVFEDAGGIAVESFEFTADADLTADSTVTQTLTLSQDFCAYTRFRLEKPGTDAWDIAAITLTIDGDAVFADPDAAVFAPVTAESYAPNGSWRHTTVYRERCAPEELVVVAPTATPTVTPAPTVPVVATLPPLPTQVILVPTANVAAAPTVTSGVTCPGFLPSRLVVGELGRVSPGLANNIRSRPSADGEQVGRIPGGNTFEILRGPECDPDGIAWWEVRYQSITGWTAEGQGTDYWLEPIAADDPSALATPTPPVTASGLQVGDSAVVTSAGNQLRMRTAPSLTSDTVTQLAEGSVVSVTEGPTSADGYVWWRITAPDGNIGWAAEGDAADLWLSPR